jgi:hypothetical protein
MVNQVIACSPDGCYAIDQPGSQEWKFRIIPSSRRSSFVPQGRRTVASGSWTLCETKPERIIYANLGEPCCPCVVYRVHNDGPSGVFVGGGIIYLDPGEDGDVSGPRIDVALSKTPVRCPPGSKTIEQRAVGTYDLLCCCCGCDCEMSSKQRTKKK